MRVIAGVFAVSVIAIVSVIPARAEVVSTELLDKRLGTEGNLATVAHTGSYNDLANKPTIPAAQVQPDWNATSGMGQIKNKPTLGTLAGKSAVTSAEITNGTIANIDISESAAIAPTKIAIDTVSTYENIPAAEKEKHIPSVALAEEISGATADAAVASAVANVGKTYQVKSTAAYQMGGANGTWTTMSTDQQNALNSKVTAAKVTTYDGYATTIANKQDKSTAVTHTANTAAGDSTHPVYVNTSGVATKIDKVAAAATADTAGSATKATQDASGNTITTTYATKTELTNGLAGKQGTLKVGSNISIAADGTISATDTNTTYGAAGTGLGLVKSGGVATVSGGQITAVSKATNADNATNATNATTATNAKKICSGSTCTAFVDIWVE